MMTTIPVQISEELAERVWPFQDRWHEIVELKKTNASTIIKIIDERDDTMRQMTRTDGSRLRQDKSSPSASRELQQISEKVKVIRFGVVRKANESSWNRLASMFVMSEPVQIEEMLHARGDEETAEGF